MDKQQQEKINQAAEQFANALKESYQSVSERSVSARELNAELAEQFFNSVIENLRSQAEDNRQLTQQLADQQERRKAATRALKQESVSAYMEFVNSMFSFAQAGPQGRPKRTMSAEEARKDISG